MGKGLLARLGLRVINGTICEGTSVIHHTSSFQTPGLEKEGEEEEEKVRKRRKRRGRLQDSRQVHQDHVGGIQERTSKFRGVDVIREAAPERVPLATGHSPLFLPYLLHALPSSAGQAGGAIMQTGESLPLSLHGGIGPGWMCTWSLLELPTAAWAQQAPDLTSESLLVQEGLCLPHAPITVLQAPVLSSLLCTKSGVF